MSTYKRHIILLGAKLFLLSPCILFRFLYAQIIVFVKFSNLSYSRKYPVRGSWTRKSGCWIDVWVCVRVWMCTNLETTPVVRLYEIWIQILIRDISVFFIFFGIFVFQVFSPPPFHMKNVIKCGPLFLWRIYVLQSVIYHKNSWTIMLHSVVGLQY